jgi:hypothetical protein
MAEHRHTPLDDADAGPDDADLEEFVSGQRRSDRIHPVRVVLAVASLLAASWILVPTVDELAYHFSRQPAVVDVGEARAEVLKSIPDNTWVRADVILGNKAAEIPALRPGSLRFGPITVREVVGAPIFVEFHDASHPTLLPFSDVSVEGRLVTFSPHTGELSSVAAWFERELSVAIAPGARAIIVDERPGKQPQYVGAWLLGLSLVVFSIGGILRRLRPR